MEKKIGRHIFGAGLGDISQLLGQPPAEGDHVVFAVERNVEDLFKLGKLELPLAMTTSELDLV